MPKTLIITYCKLCKKQTPHEVQPMPGGQNYSKDGTGGNLHCTKCGSQRAHTIQGFDASLM